MTTLAYVTLALYFGLAFGWRSWLQWRRTGSTGFRGFSGRVGSAEWWGGVLFAVAVVLAIAAPVADDLGLVASVAFLRAPPLLVVGIALAAAGIVGTLWAQRSMGDAWRIGVDPRERTTLVHRGPFRVVRNPIFSSMVVGLAGIALMTPNPVALVALATLVIGLELQVRQVEEPYLLGVHGEAYRAYAARTGRFVPGVGRLETQP
jgi:protein-S-isoprenylcysteine O-methyltransferase Ste14